MRKILGTLEQEKATTEDRVYPASYHNKEGYLTLLNKKLAFIELRGFLQPSYHMIFEIPFTQIDFFDDVSCNTVVVTELNGLRHYITIYGVSPMTMSKTLSNLVIKDMINS